MPSNLLNDLFRAYFDARKHKRKTAGALRFEMDYEAEIFKLYDEIVSGTYKIAPSVCFISFQPVKREIFAGDFRDRIVHHLLFNYLNPLCERLFIHDSYSCRAGKGTTCGIRRAKHFIRSCSENYRKDCYVLKLDISGYFMSIDRRILFKKIEKLLDRSRSEIDFDRDLILELVRKVIFNDPTRNCVIKGERKDWIGLPRSKSLFFSVKESGLPIGNLTSQLFANLYLDDFDHFIKSKLGCRYYGRYVDDLFFVHQSKLFLLALFPALGGYLRSRLSLRLHPKKIYLQHFRHGVAFLGVFILPYRTYLKNRTKGNIHKKMEKWLIISRNGRISGQWRKTMVSRYFSYRGMLGGCDAYNLGQKFKARLSVGRIVFLPA